MTSSDKDYQKYDVSVDAILAELLDALPVVALAATESGIIKQANKAAATLFGHPQSQFTGMNLNQFIRSDTTDADSIAIAAQGNTFPVRLQRKATKLGESSIIICTIIELHQESKLQEEVQNLTKELQASREEIESFITVASHDLRSPLRRCKSFLDLLAANYQPLFDEQGQDWIERCAKNLDHMQTLVSDLATFSGIDSKVVAPRSCNLQALATDEFAKLRQTEHPNAEIRFKSDLPQVSGDQQLLGLLFNNLFSNSLAYNDSEIPTVEIQCLSTGDGWQLTITDNGLGIEEKYRSRVFDFFKRLHSDLRYPGNGLGLAISQRIAEYHKGSLSLATIQPNQGSSFILILPRG